MHVKRATLRLSYAVIIEGVLHSKDRKDRIKQKWKVIDIWLAPWSRLAGRSHSVRHNPAYIPRQARGYWPPGNLAFLAPHNTPCVENGNPLIPVRSCRLEIDQSTLFLWKKRTRSRFFVECINMASFLI